MSQNYPAIITAAFAEKDGTPALGLIPSIHIWQLTSTVGSPQGDVIIVGTEGGSPIVPMTEVGQGFYKYVFTTYDSTLKYAYHIDGEVSGTGPKLGFGRYAVGTNENFAEDVAHEVWEEPKNLHLTGSPETMGSVLNQILTSTLGSPQAVLTVSSIVSGVWNELVLGSPQPFPTGSAGGVLKLISETSGLTQAQVAAAVWSAKAADYAFGSPMPGSPISMGSQLNLTTDKTCDILTFTETLLKSQYNRTVLDKAAFTLTIYDNDGVTPIRVFDLREFGVGASITEITERLPASGSPLTP